MDTHLRKALEPGLKIAVTLRYMATGNDYRDLEYSFRVPHNTISLFVPKVAQAIVDEFSNEVIKPKGTSQIRCLGVVNYQSCAVHVDPMSSGRDQKL